MGSAATVSSARTPQSTVSSRQEPEPAEKAAAERMANRKYLVLTETSLGGSSRSLRRRPHRVRTTSSQATSGYGSLGPDPSLGPGTLDPTQAGQVARSARGAANLLIEVLND